jgi:hypothetical protein
MSQALSGEELLPTFLHFRRILLADTSSLAMRDVSNFERSVQAALVKLSL